MLTPQQLMNRQDTVPTREGCADHGGKEGKGGERRGYEGAEERREGLENEESN